MYVVIPTTLVWVLYGTAIPTSPVKFMQMFFFTLATIYYFRYYTDTFTLHIHVFAISGFSIDSSNHGRSCLIENQLHKMNVFNYSFVYSVAVSGLSLLIDSIDYNIDLRSI